MSVKIVGLGHEARGDDGIGPRVIEALRAGELPAHVSLARASDGAALLELLAPTNDYVLVDAVADPEHVGSLHCLEPHQLKAGVGPRSRSSTSSHALGVAESLGIADALGQVDLRRVLVLGVGIDPQRCLSFSAELSPEVSGAIAPASRRALALAARLRDA